MVDEGEDSIGGPSVLQALIVYKSAEMANE
jgi:hypothetical protein